MPSGRSSRPEARIRSSPRPRARAKWIPFTGLGILALAAVALVGVALTMDRSVDGAVYVAPVETPTATEEPTPTLVEQLAGTEPVTIVVVGDSTGYDDVQWVMTMATDLSAKYNRSTNISRWNRDTVSYDGASAVGNGTGAPLTIWNGSAPGEAPVYSSTNLKALVPLENPSVIIVSHGHNTGPEPVLDISRLTSKITASFPDTTLAVTVQNPALTTDSAVMGGRSSAIRDWIGEHADWVAIDVYTAYTIQPDMDSLYLDARHPNGAGGRVWADTAETALGI